MPGTNLGPDSVVVVTGGASGIGLGLARAFVSVGASLVLADVEAPALEAAAAELGRSGAEVHTVVTDVMSFGSVEALADRAFGRYGRVDVLCSNAGVNGVVGARMWELPLAEWEWILGVNLWGVIHGIRAFVPRMVGQGSGHIVNTASMAAITEMPIFAPYTASKHAVLAVSETLQLQFEAEDLPLGVTVLLPGRVDTNIRRAARNWPQGLGPRDRSQDGDTFHDGGPASVNADDIGAMVVDAVRDGRFWLPAEPGNPAAGDRVRQRFAAIVGAFKDS